MIIPIFIFIFAFSIRLVYLNQIKSSPLFTPSRATIDELLYDQWAKDIAFKDPVGKEPFWGLPLYPYFLGVVYFIFGANVFIARFIQILIGAANCVLIYIIGKRIFGRSVGIISGFAFAVYNGAIFNEALLTSSSIGVLLNCCLILSILSLDKKPGYKNALSLGLILGLASLASPSLLLFLPMLFFWFSRDIKRYFLASVLICLSLISCVTIRNYMVSHDFIPITSHGGITFYAGNNPTAIGTSNLPSILGTDIASTRQNSKAIAEQISQKSLRPSEVSSFWFRQGMSFIKKQPLQYAKLLIRKFLLFWNRDEIFDIISITFCKRFAPILRLPLLSYGIISAFSMVGLFMAAMRKNRNYILLMLFMLSNLLSLMAYFVNSRYRFPVVPLLVLFAAYCVYTLYGLIKEKKTAAVLVCVGGLAGSFVIGGLKLAKTTDEVFYTNMGVLYTEKKMYDKAMNEFKMALKERPDYPFAYINLGYLYLNMQNYDEAVNIYKKALQLLPDYPISHNNLAIAYKRLGKFDEAIHEYARAAELNPGFADAYYNLGLLYFDRGAYDISEKYFMQALAADPQLSEAKGKIDMCKKAMELQK